MKTQKRRRKQGKTDYKKRMNLLKGLRPRVTFRKTNRYLVVQYILSNEAQDKIVFGITSKKLLKYGWPKNFEGSLKSIPASYLTGYLFGKIILEKKLKEPIIDFGMLRTLHKSKIYSFLKGIIDSGIKIQCDKEIFPEEERIKGKSLKEDFSKEFEKIKLNIEKELK